MANTTRSRKAKGRRLQNEVRDTLLESFPELDPTDVKVALMGESGEDLKLSRAAREKIPYSFECKNTEKLNVWKSLEQADVNSSEYLPILVFKRNRSKTYAVIEFPELVRLIKFYENNKNHCSGISVVNTTSDSANTTGS